jgi:hypothetical protein
VLAGVLTELFFISTGSLSVTGGGFPPFLSQSTILLWPPEASTHFSKIA